ncbi:MgtC/SapB family protein [Paenibacillus barengoltzii]|jgi:putative Mg2+ transporter-C (MgtC) family protein|uniref:Mg2+ transporter-C (MgtC) family protein n=1 Tax=Paenibacillus barengoltzii J12 TaxID=935846 RepID=A0ABY1LZZ5_9BACL|nr:MgtC/SapB family protein [Paenibacillus barengoltzii]MEC2344229.1 MgtC/SapB family protein [Paenibacillus barengoltzii]SMF22928.1 putative Mg2+ transporter-C (MgtC) family protein [Paenibacillus barengoltzii J12]
MKLIDAGLWNISYVDLSLRIVISLLLGGLIGLEREWHNHAAGFRTHILVCVGSTVIMLLSIYGFGDFSNEYNVRMDPARLAAQVVSGIGFLGAGAIIRNGSSISGLTTAASIWVVAAIGLCVGAGFFFGAVLVTVLVIIILVLLNKFEKSFHNKRSRNEVTVRILNKEGGVAKVAELFEQEGLLIVNMSLEAPNDDQEDEGESVRTLRIKLHKPRSKDLLRVFDKLLTLDCIHSFETAEALRSHPAHSSISGTRTL